jgi:steroid 5-alpha reductase family enzyme
MSDLFTLLVTGSLVSVALFALTWWLSVRLDNYSFVDVMWSYALSVIIPLYAVMAQGWGPRRVVAAVVAVTWSVRLGTYLLARIRRHFPKEDARYEALRVTWQDGMKWKFFLFFQGQGLVVALMSVPFAMVCLAPQMSFGWMELLGAGMAMIGVGGEALSDAQRAAFRASRRGGVCDLGLWKWSRHPNYFFEFVVWVGVWLMACGAAPWGVVTVFVPLMMLYFLLKVTGIPLTEQHELQRHGAAYEAYQRRTSAFVPWPPRG